MISLESIRKVELGKTLAALRERQGLTRADAAQAAGMTAGMLRDYERGARKPRHRNLLRLLNAWGCSVVELEDMLEDVRQGKHDLPSRGQTPEQAVREVTNSLERLAGARLRSPSHLLERVQPADQIRGTVLRAKTVLSTCPIEDWLEITKEIDTLRSAAFCEMLCNGSEAACRSDVQQAIRLAEIAVAVAELILAEPSLRSRAVGYCLAFLANAYRVAGDLPSARATFLRSDAFWGSNSLEESDDILDGTRILDLRASLHRAERQIPEALALLDRALAIGPRTASARARILIKRAGAYEELKHYEASVASLQEAATLLDAEADPVLVLVHRFNLLENLYQLGRVDEAEPLIPEVRELVAQLGNDLDRLRLRWLEGRILALRGEEAEAASVLRGVRSDFHKRQIAFDVALVTLELAELLLRQGQTDEVKELAEETFKIFGKQGIKPEAEKALRLFCEAALAEAATVELVRRVLAEVEGVGRG